MKKLSAFLSGLMLLAAGCNGSSNGPNGKAYQQAITGYNPNATTATTTGGGTANPTGVKSGTGAAGATGTTPGSTTGTTPGSTGSTGSSAGSKWVYLADANDTITTFAIDPATGALSGAADTALPAGFGPMALAVDPTNSILFVTGVGATTPGNQIMPIAIASGTLTPGTAAKTANILPFGVCVDPASESVFTADFNYTGSSTSTTTAPPPGTTSAFTYATGSGALAAGTPASVTLLSNPTAVCMDPQGGYLFCAEAGQLVEILTVKGGAIDPTSAGGGVNTTHQCNAVVLAGATLIVGNVDDTLSTFDLSSTAASGPPEVVVTIHAAGSAKALVSGLAVDSTGAFLVSANGGTAGGGTATDDCTLFSVSGATVTVIGSTTAVAASSPTSVAFDTTGSICYVANAGNSTVDVFAVSATGLTPVTGSPFAMTAGGGSNPFGIAVSK